MAHKVKMSKNIFLKFQDFNLYHNILHVDVDARGIT